MDSCIYCSKIYNIKYIHRHIKTCKLKKNRSILRMSYDNLFKQLPSELIYYISSYIHPILYNKPKYISYSSFRTNYTNTYMIQYTSKMFYYYFSPPINIYSYFQ